MNTPENNEAYRTALACCTDIMEELLVVAFYERPTIERAAAVAAIVNERGYSVTPEEVLEQQ